MERKVKNPGGCNDCYSLSGPMCDCNTLLPIEFTMVRNEHGMVLITEDMEMRYLSKWENIMWDTFRRKPTF